MCTHYEKNTQVVEWAVTKIAGVTIDTNLAPFPEHTWPKSIGPVVTQTAEGRVISTMRWGISVPIKGATKLLTKYVVNARDDKLGAFPWRFAVRERRCLIPATAYFEPDGPPKAKWEVRFTLRERPAFFLAGLWENEKETGVRSFTMVTTGPNELAAKIHDRMPLILDDVAAEAWLGHTALNSDKLRDICRPYPAAEMLSIPLLPPQKAVRKADLLNASDELPLE